LTFRPSVYRVCVRVLKSVYGSWPIPPPTSELVTILRSNRKKLWRREGIDRPNKHEAEYAARIFLEIEREAKRSSEG